MVTTRRDAEQDARHEAAVVERVVADGQGLALAAEQDLLVGDQPAQPHGVHGHAVDVRAAGAVQRGAVASGCGARAGLARGPRRSAGRCAWRCRTGASTLFGWCSSMTSTDSK